MERSPEENLALLNRLALRLLVHPYDPNAQQPQLLPGSLPSALPLDLPLPEGHEVLGSFVRSPEEIQIVLDVAQSPEEIIAFYTQRMQAAGWSEPEHLRRQRQYWEGGFVQTPHYPRHVGTFCKGPHGPALLVSALKGQDANAKTEIRLHIDTRSRFSPCAQSSEIFMQVGKLIPALEPPPGGRQHNLGGGGSDSESASSSADLSLEQDVALSVLSAHYARQLEQAGWKRTGEGQSEPMAWYSWELRDEKDEHWLGVFSLLKVPGMERNYYLQIYINWVEGTATN